MVDKVSKKRQLVSETILQVRGSSMCKIKGIKLLASVIRPLLIILR